MGFFSVFAMKEASWTLRVKAVFNVIGMVYFTSTVSVGVILAWFISIPKLVEAQNFSSTKHYLISLFICINVIGNYLLTVFTDTSTATLRSPVAIAKSTTTMSHRGQTKNREDTQRDTTTTRSVNRSSRSKAKHHVHFSDTYTFIKPLRAFDCQLCNSCILKRDHHCFFIGSCIGYHNQKYFINCCGYLAFGCSYSLILTTLYLHIKYGTQFEGAWTFVYLLPLTVVSWLQGNTPIGEIAMVLFLYICLVGGVTGIGFWLWESHITFLGLTTYEAMHGLSGPNKSSFIDNFRDVFGKYWYIGMFLPIKLPQYGNGTYTLSREKKCYR